MTLGKVEKGFFFCPEKREEKKTKVRVVLFDTVLVRRSFYFFFALHGAYFIKFSIKNKTAIIQTILVCKKKLF